MLLSIDEKIFEYTNALIDIVSKQHYFETILKEVYFGVNGVDYL